MTTPDAQAHKLADPTPTRDGTLHVFVMSGGPDSVVAHSADDAWTVWEETTGESRTYYELDEEWVQEPDDKPLTIVEVDEPGRPKETKTCGEWAASNGRGFLCSTEY